MKVYLIGVDYEGCLTCVFTTLDKAIAYAAENYGDSVFEVELDATPPLRRKAVWEAR